MIPETNLPKAKEGNYKILSLDGGGTWALLQVLTLKKIFEKKDSEKIWKGHEILAHFDLVIANSGGSMVLAALACNWTFDKIEGLFTDPEITSEIFDPLSFRDRYFPANFMKLIGIKNIGTRYSATSKIRALKAILKVEGGRKLEHYFMDELPALIGKPSLQIIVCTFDIINKRAKLFRSYKDSLARAEKVANSNHFDRVNLVEAIHGSSNAPVNYFDFPAIFSPANSKKRFYLWDGALGGFNNPVMAGLTEAMANGIRRSDIHVLSIGTASKLVSEMDTRSFRDSYYSTILGRNVKHKEDGSIDFDKTIYAKTPFGKIKRPRLFNRTFRGSKLYGETISNLSQTILFEPQSWATYSAFVHLFSDNLNASKNNKRFTRLSPQIINKENATQIIKDLYKMDMDVSSAEEIKLLESCFDLWQKGDIINEPVQWVTTINDEYIFARGHRTFKDALKDLNWV
ncbi:MAG: patatin-like phospholipase/acyl hydrolase [Patiriisocius sp.]|jgi:patatin-like phospholipase/acyl hydrolase